MVSDAPMSELVQKTCHRSVRKDAIKGDAAAYLKPRPGGTAFVAESEIEREVIDDPDNKRRWSELNRRWRICNPLP